MKHTLCLIAFVIISTLSFSQTKTDSLRNLILSAEGRHKVDLQDKLLMVLTKKETRQEYNELANEMYKLADSLDYKKGKWRSLLHIGSASLQTNDYAAARDHHLRALSIAEKLKDIENISESIRHIEDVYFQLREFDSALLYNDKALAMANSCQDTSVYTLHLSQRIKILIYAGRIKQAIPLVKELDTLVIYISRGDITEKINQTRALFYYTTGDYPKAIPIYKILKERYEQNGNLHYLSITCFQMGNAYYRYNQTDSAIHYHLLSINCKPPDMNVRLTARSYNSIGAIYKARNELEKALENFHRSVELKAQINDTIGTAVTQMNISTVYRAMGNYEKAIEYNMKSLQVFLRNNTERHLATLYNNLGNIYLDQKMGDSCIYYFRNALILRTKLESLSGVSNTANGLGNYFYQLEHNMDSALHYYNLALDGYIEMEHAHGIAETNAYIADCYYQMGKYNKAVTAYTQSIPELEKERSYDNLVDIYKNLAASYYKTGKYKMSYEAQVKHQQLQDSIFNEKNIKTIAEMQEKYDSELKQTENESLQQKLEFARNKTRLVRTQNWLLIASLTLTALLAVSLIIYFRNKRRSDQLNLQLAEQEKQNIALENKARKAEEKRLNDVLFAEKQVNKLQGEKLEQSRKKLHSTSLQIIKQNQRFQTLKLMFKEIEWKQENNREVATDMLIYIDQSLDCEMKWVEFRHEFDESYPGFIDTLSAKYTMLTDRELQLLAMVRTNLTSRQIADIICIEEESVKKSRSRIIKKMGIELETTLYDYLCEM